MNRILWIEDEGKIELIQYKAPLVRGGYAVDIASNATEAVQLLREKRYDAIIFDLIFPCGDEFETNEYYVGLELLKRLVKQEIEGVEKYDPAKIIVFTVVNDSDVQDQIKELGVQTILGKRLNELDDLKNCVDALFEENKPGVVNDAAK
jgi:CheY-like chemotaxis protein